MEPPALPVKQHRSHSSRSSSVGHDCGPLSPVELHGSNADDVFAEATDCHAAQCPIHQCYDSSQHLMRFFSDEAPPPVPRKRLARTLSLPCPEVPPPSPLSPRLRPPRDFDNPLYMMIPARSRHFTVEAEHFEACRGGSEPSSPYSQVSLDMPDEHLLHLFGGFTDQWEVLRGVQHCHLVFLRRMAQRVDAGILLQQQSRGKEVDSYLPEDFVLQEGSEARQVGDAVYYRLHSPKFPCRLLALKVHRQSDESHSVAVAHQPPHANVQEVVAHFRPRDVRSSGFSDSPQLEPEAASVQSFLQRGHPVSVERDLPLFTLEDFVHSGASLQALDNDDRLSALMLQVLNGLAHLYQNGSSVSQLRPCEIYLVWPLEGPEEGGENVDGRKESGPERTKEKSAKMGMLWRKHGCPRVVLNPAGSSLPGARTLLYIKSQISALIDFCLQSGDSRTSMISGAARSLQQRELLRLASRLQSDGSDGPQLEAAIVALQELIWGPGVPLREPRGHCWLMVKRAMFVMKLAERGLSPEQRALPWEDVMHLKYLSSADSEAAVAVRE